ncbi:MAG: TIGR01777 family protein [Bacteroidetes bacterium]|nr:TIGR01777 family protein [Bacteroidota bacterium]
MKILITGASGLIGTRLTDILLQRGFKVAHIGRKKTRDARVLHFTWDPQNGIMDEESIRWADVVVNLAGASVSERRWTSERKKEIIESRTSSLRTLAKKIRDTDPHPEVVITASGVGWYGATTTENIFSENDPPANDFFGQCCKEWEEAGDLFEELSVRVVKLRIGAVLARNGGAIPKLAAPVKWYIGAPLGNGKQWMPWIHIDDLCELIIFSILNKNISGVYNATGTQQVTNKQFMRSLGKVLHRPVFFPGVPKFALKLFLGERACMILEGSRVSNKKITETGFVFRNDELSTALENIFAK